MMVVMVLLRSEKAISRNQREKDICNTEYYWKVRSGQRAIESRNSIGYHKKRGYITRSDSNQPTGTLPALLLQQVCREYVL